MGQSIQDHAKMANLTATDLAYGQMGVPIKGSGGLEKCMAKVCSTFVFNTNDAGCGCTRWFSPVLKVPLKNLHLIDMDDTGDFECGPHSYR
jgi:hypothetical protein